MAEKLAADAVGLALEIQREIEARYEETEQLRCRTSEGAQGDADLAEVAHPSAAKA